MISRRAFCRRLGLLVLGIVLSAGTAHAQSGRVGDRVWYDIDADGVQDAGEPGYFGATVYLRTTTGSYVTQASTDANGTYLMTGVGAGTYYLELAGGSCLGLTLSPQDQGGNDSLDSDFVPATFRTPDFVYSGSDNASFDVGVTTQPMTVSVRVWFESDFDGLREAGEAGVSGVQVYLYSENCVGTWFQGATNASGDFTFANFLPAASATRRFRLLVSRPGSRYFTRQDQGGDDTVDSDVDAGGYSVDFAALAGATIGIDAGLITDAAGPVTIGNRVWHDADSDGIQDAGEAGYGAIPLRLGSSNYPYLGDANTGSTGNYGFTVAPGRYRVQFTSRSCLGVTMSPLDQGGDDTIDSDSDANGVTALVEVYAGSETTIDLGIQQAPASLTGRVFFDTDGDGLRDAGEPGIAGATVQLESPCWGTVATVASDSGGNYAFPSMPPYLASTSDYRVRFALPSGYYYTQQDQGADDALDSDADTAGYTSYFDAPAGGARSGVDAGFIPNTIGTVRIGDRVWFDSDADGVQDPGEPGMTSPYFQLESSNGGYLGQAFSNLAGIYGFSGTSPGFHRLRAYGPNCMGIAVSPLDASGDDALDSDFSGSPPSTSIFSAGVGLNFQWDLGVTTPPAAIGGQVWQDLDADGIRDAGEPAVGGMLMELNFLDCYGYSYAYSKSDGTFAFPYVMASNSGRRYRVRAIQSGFTGYSPADQGGDDAVDSDVDSSGTVPSFTLAPSGSRMNIGVGVVGGTLRSLGDRAWQDLDADGQQDAGETGLDGVDVRLLDPDGQTVAQTTTSGGGAYAFGGLMQQTYSLEFVLPAGFAFTLKDQGSDTTDSDVDPSTSRTSTFFLSGVSDTSRDAGLLPADPASVGDRVWLDLDGDGIQDAGEGGVANVTVSLRNAAGVLISQAATDAAGAFTFANILPGDYRLTFTLPSGFVFSPQDQGGNDAADSDASVVDGQTALFTLAAGANDATRDAGLIPDALATVGNYVWNDADADGVQDAGESGLGGVTVRLLTSGGSLVTSTTTDASGSYGFANLASGDYFVEFVLPALFEFSPANQTSDALDSDANVATGRSHTFNLSLGEDETSIDAGMNPIDNTPPRVSNLDSVATSGGAIGEGEVVNVEITQLLVSFDEAMDATLAGNAGNYLLIFGGNDGTLDTAACGPLQGDDQSVSVNSATYAGQTSTLSVSGATALTDGTYRLLVCASLEDVAGNPLDGDSNGSGGDDFARSFSVDLVRPTVTLVQTEADTGDGALGENEATNVAITELSVSFSETVLGGDSLSNFFLVEAGLDGTLDTAACGPLAGDDVSVVIDSAVYVSLGSTSTLALSGGAVLADGTYRLLVCGTVTDLGGNAIDDDDDDDGNDDFERNFIVDTVPPTNPTAISSSTHVLGAWSPVTGFVAEWSGGTDDRSGRAGYSVVIDDNPSTAVDCTIEVTDAAGTGSISATLGEGAKHVHVRLVDRAGNCAVGETEAGFWGIDTSAPTAPGAISSPSHDPTGTPVADDTIDVAWDAASDTFSGVASYSYAFDGNPSGGCAGGSSTAALTATSGALADGSWYLHVCAVDFAGNVGTPAHSGAWIIDRLPPDSLVVTSPSHSPSTWSNDNGVDFVFSGANDANGVAGYAVVYDQSSATDPTCTATQTGTTFTGSSSPDGDHWWIHVRAVDAAGNCGDAVHFGPFWIDTTSPGAPGTVSSSSHDGGPTNDPTIGVAWDAASDTLSGIDGYSFFFNGVDQDCDLTMDSDDDERSATSPPLAAGTWYFHVCAVDLAGNWGAVTTGGPYTIDLSAPKVTNLDSLATSGGAIGESEVVNVEITQLLVSFDEAMDATLAEATGSYLLVAAGIDGVLDTAACGPLQGDDQSLSVDAATYAGQTSTLTVNGATALADGTYRLFVCASLADLAGNPLDGNGDGSSGDDFARSFRVDLTPPTVTVVQTVADTGDGALTELEPTNVAITEVLVTFDEELVGGDSTANFFLVEGGLDGTLETSVCGPLAGDDTSVAIDGAVHASLTSTLALNGGAALPDGEYRLLVCATLTDLGGNALDGDDDGDGHDDFARTFTVDTVPPTNPTAISSSTHVLGAWSPTTGFAANWSGASDDRSGPAGYSVVIDGNPTAAVDCTIEVADSAGTGSTAATLGEGAWYVHVRLRDRAGNCAVGEAEAGFWGIDTSAPGVPGAISSSSHDPVSSPVSDPTIAVAWGAASDGLSGIAGYSFHFSADDDEDCDGETDSPEDERTAVSPPLADGSWYFHVCAVDLAGNGGPTTHGGPWIVDTTPPASLAVSSSSHTVSTWSNDAGVDFGFSGATDANGVAGYAVIYDPASATEPACTTTQAGTTFTGSSSPDGNHWWIHVRARDTAGNCGTTVHFGPFWIDTVAPGTVSGLVSTDHAVGLPSIDPTIAMSWTAATDDRSGVAGYSVQFSNSASTTCDGGLETASTSFTSAALAHGDWYVQVCARDEAGNWGAVVQAGPYTVDLVAPQVVLVDSVVPTADNQLSEGETTGLAITQLRVTFGEGMSTSVSLPSSYRLIAAGSDGFQTVSCAGGVSPQDLAVAIDSVSALGGSTYGLAVHGGAELPTGDYRLLACASLTDAAGNHLDGNGDTVANDDFVRSFTIDRSPPTVMLVETTAPTSGAGLDEDEATNVALTTFAVTFSEAVYDPIGNTNPDDVTNPGNYRLLAAGGDGFQTLSCQAGVDPADVALAVDGVVYDAPTRTATLAVNGGLVLGEERYRLYVCGSAAIIDLVGLPLDGDGDGSGGDDFVRNFQVDMTPPSNPVLTPNLPPGVWTNSHDLVVTWSGASDGGSGSGLAGYSVLFDLASGTDPGTSVDVLEAAAHQAAATLADGAPHYFHLVTCDRAGNCAPPIETGPFQVDTQAPSSPAPVSSSSHGDGLPHSNAAIAVSWTASSDQPGLSGVSTYLVSLQTVAAPPVCGGTSTGSTSTTLAAPADGSYYVHVCAVDFAGNAGAVAVGGPYVVDTAGPTGLVVSSSSHSVSTWSNDNTVDFSWSGATDPSGIAGYAVAFDPSSATEPACAATQTASTFTGSSSPDGGDWWIHVRAIDNAGNCGATSHLGPFQVDTQNPSAPTGLASPSHEVGVASNDNTVEVDWQAAIDQAGLSGIDGYGFFFSTGEDDDCDGEIDVEEGVLQATSDALADGEHHFHLCAVDNAGNWSPVASIGPFVIDTAGAAVVAISTVADTGDGELAEGESTQAGLTQLTVAFDGAMFDASGDSDPADVTNPENYRLYQGGTDGVMQTIACGTAAGDDVEVPFAAASYSSSTTTAALSLSGSFALPRESYRLVVCPTLEDDAGTAIAAFTRNFTVTATDLLANPNFDLDLGGWVATEPLPGSLLWSSSDLSSALTSGSAEILTAAGSRGVWALSQCFGDFVGPFESSGWTTIESTVPGAPVVGVRLDFFDAAGCSGALLDSTLSPPVAGDTGGFRTYLQLARSGSPEAARSVLMTVQVEGGAAASFTVRLDDLFHGRPPALFTDGFESSDMSAWSLAVP